MISSMSSKQVYLFQGGNDHSGISIESFCGLKKILSENFQARVIPWNHETHPPITWASKSICMFPGGICSKWKELLSENLQKQIGKWVSEGGKIFGVCAGAYFCSEQSDFKVDSSTNIKTIRQISIFRGICRGPLFTAHIKIIKIKWMRTGQEGCVAMIKGGELIPAEKDAQEILALYKDSIIAVKTTKGILSTVHFEIGKEDVLSLAKYFPKLEKKVSLLEESREFRLSCLREMYEKIDN